jgi:hypothetical protein
MAQCLKTIRFSRRFSRDIDCPRACSVRCDRVKQAWETCFAELYICQKSPSLAKSYSRKKRTRKWSGSGITIKARF